jgi:hypothetical protein
MFLAYPLPYYPKSNKMNKKIMGTAMLLGIGLVYCFRLLTGNSRPHKMKAIPQSEPAK